MAGDDQIVDYKHNTASGHNISSTRRYFFLFSFFCFVLKFIQRDLFMYTKYDGVYDRDREIESRLAEIVTRNNTILWQANTTVLPDKHLFFISPAIFNILWILVF